MLDKVLNFFGRSEDAEKRVKYNTFSSMSSEELYRWVDKRKHHVVKHQILDWLAVDPYLEQNFSVLDVGCGPGVFLKMLMEHPTLADRVTYTGLDQNEGALSHCRNAYPDQHHFTSRDFLASGLPDGHFDVIVVNEVVEHLPNYEALVDMAFAKKPTAFVLAGFAIEPTARRNRIRWNQQGECYMNQYSFAEMHDYLRSLAADRPLFMADWGTRAVDNNSWFPVKTGTVFYAQLNAPAKRTNSQQDLARPGPRIA
jgi:SAM-dependent methyltransferase